MQRISLLAGVLEVVLTDKKQLYYRIVLTVLPIIYLNCIPFGKYT